MDLNTYLDSLTDSVTSLGAGRKGLATIGEEAEGHRLFDDGIATAMTAFQEAKDTADPQVLILAELVFLQQELQFCDEKAKATRSSLNQAVQDFEDALRCLKTVENKVLYQAAETTHLTRPEKRVQGFPKDAFHQACHAHRTRIQNYLRIPGMNQLEAALYELRFSNMAAASSSYTEKQRAAFGGELYVHGAGAGISKNMISKRSGRSCP
ncbi:hypothetical protein AGMMS50268_14040 [Spirochaetia bacterium]|nr:hypothetical protein AGMMS50268_14040 [Spirochaetia bacterium]